jgi:hypothetical protein
LRPPDAAHAIDRIAHARSLNRVASSRQDFLSPRVAWNRGAR